jgi:hypothetical protein
MFILKILFRSGESMAKNELHLLNGLNIRKGQLLLTKTHFLLPDSVSLCTPWLMIMRLKSFESGFEFTDTVGEKFDQTICTYAMVEVNSFLIATATHKPKLVNATLNLSKLFFYISLRLVYKLLWWTTLHMLKCLADLTVSQLSLERRHL